MAGQESLPIFEPVKLVEQISVFVENKPGRLGRLCEVLSGVGVNIRAMMVPSGTDYGLVHLIAEPYEEALQALEQHSYRVYTSRVIDVELEDAPGTLTALAEQLSNSEIDITYAYAAVASGRGRLVLSVSDADRAIKVLRA